MKKTVLTFGLISGAVSSVLMLSTVPFMDRIGFSKGLIVGYTAIVLSFLLVFFGVRSYRENVGYGEISFGRALSVGLLIALISSVCYVITWEIVYFNLMPDFAEKYTSYALDDLRASGASQQVIDAKLVEMKALKVLLDNPLSNAAMTILEPLPIGVLISLISAAVLRKRKVKNDEQSVGEAVPSS